MGRTPPSPLARTGEGGNLTPPLLLLLTLLVLACGGGSGSADPTDARMDDLAATDAPASPDAIGDALLPGDATPTFQAIAGEPKVGNYHLVTDDLELSVTVTDGRLFVLRAKVGCKGPADTPCVYTRAVPVITCSTAYAQGYTAPLVDNHAVVPVKDDRLELWVTAADRLEGVYHLTPGKCCEAHVVVSLPNVDAVACVNYQTPDCDPLATTGCPDGQHCVFDGDGRPTCAPDGPTALGGACDGGAAACADGACIDVGGTGSRCYRYCKIAADCAPVGVGLGCLELVSSPYKVCQLPLSAFEACDLLAPACTNAGEACYPTTVTTGPICVAAGATAEGEPCQADSACAAGLLCANGACRAICGVGGQPPCADPFAKCQAVYYGAGACIGQ